GFKMESSRVVRGRKNVERKVLRQSSTGMEIQPAPIKSMGGDFSLAAKRCAVGAIHRHLVGAFPMPDGRHAEGHRPIGRLLEDGGIAIVPHLIAVVFELLAKGA